MNEDLKVDQPSTSRVFHTLLVFRCPTMLSEALAGYATRHNLPSISRAIRDLLTAALKQAD